MKKMIFFYIILFIIIALNTIAYNTIDMDFWARLLQGNAFFELGYILKLDPFSYTQTHLWLDHEWGSSVVFSFLQNNFGFNGILLFRTILVFLIFFFIFKTINLQTEKRNNGIDIVLFWASIVAMPTLIQSGLRCHFFTFLFFTIFIYILELVRKKGKNNLLFLLPLIMLFWSNMHGGCVSGLGLIGIYAIGEFLNKKPYKKYFIVLLISLFVLFINPYGVDYVKFIFMASTMSRPFVTEWISPFMHPNWMAFIEFKILYLFYFLVLLFGLKKIKADYTKYLLLIVCAFVSFKYVKNMPFFVIASFVFLYKDIFDFIQNKKIITEKLNLFTFSFYIFLFLCSLYQVTLSYGYSFLREQPIQVVDFIKINQLKGRILAPFDMGSYIAYKLYPDNLIYMDGRYEEVYYRDTKDNLDKFYNIQQGGEEVLSDKPELIIVPSDALLNDYLVKNNDYKLIYKDSNNMLYSIKTNLKESYKLPSNDYHYYIKNAFKTNFKFTDDITIKGEKVIFK